MQCCTSSEGRGYVVHNNSPPRRPTLQPTYAERLRDIIKPKEGEPSDKNKPRRPTKRAPPEKAQRHDSEFIQNYFARIFPAHAFGGFTTESYGKIKSHHCQPQRGRQSQRMKNDREIK